MIERDNAHFFAIYYVRITLAAAVKYEKTFSVVVCAS